MLSTTEAPEAVDGTEQAQAIAPVAPAPSTPRKQQPRTPGITYNQFLFAQLPLLLVVALICGGVALAARQYLPATTGTGSAAATGGAVTGGGVSSGPITAFSPGAAAQQVVVDADPTGALKWTKATYEAKAGDVTFVVNNKSSSVHNFAVEGPGVMIQGPNFGAGSTNTYTIKGLPPGEYLLVCNYPGHRAAGMVAKLIVT